MNEQDDLYQDPRFEMYSEDAQFKMMLKVYGVAFAFVVLIIMPWCIGAGMLIKWIIF